MSEKELADISGRWNGTAKGYTRLTFEEALADMQVLMSAVRKSEELKRRIAELEAHVIKRNNDMQAFAAEVARLASQKYADYMPEKAK